MKKLVLAALVAVMLVDCTGNAVDKVSVADSTAVNVDTTVVAEMTVACTPSCATTVSVENAK